MRISCFFIVVNALFGLTLQSGCRRIAHGDDGEQDAGPRIPSSSDGRETEAPDSSDTATVDDSLSTGPADTGSAMIEDTASHADDTHTVSTDTVTSSETDSPADSDSGADNDTLRDSDTDDDVDSDAATDVDSDSDSDDTESETAPGEDGDTVSASDSETSFVADGGDDTAGDTESGSTTTETDSVREDDSDTPKDTGTGEADSWTATDSGGDSEFDTGQDQRDTAWLESCLPEPLDADRRYPGPCVEEWFESDACDADRRWTKVYDEAERLIRHEYDYDADGVADVVVTYTYDDSGHLLRKETDGSWPANPADGVVDARVSKSYDEDGHLVLEETDGPPADGVPDSSFAYTYGTDGRRAIVAYDDTPGDDEPLYYQYLVYNEDGHLELIWYDDPPFDGYWDAVETRTYDEAGRLIQEEIDHRPADGVPEHLNVYVYDTDGLLLEVRKDDVDSVSKCWTYTYDDNGREATEVYDEGCTGDATLTETYSYDENGYLSSTQTSDGDMWTYERNASGRLTGQRLCNEDCTYWEWHFDDHNNPLYEVVTAIPSDPDASVTVTSYKRYNYDCWL